MHQCVRFHIRNCLKELNLEELNWLNLNKLNLNIDFGQAVLSTISISRRKLWNHLSNPDFVKVCEDLYTARSRGSYDVMIMQLCKENKCSIVVLILRHSNRRSKLHVSFSLKWQTFVNKTKNTMQHATCTYLQNIECVVLLFTHIWFFEKILSSQDKYFKETFLKESFKYNKIYYIHVLTYKYSLFCVFCVRRSHFEQYRNVPLFSLQYVGNKSVSYEISGNPFRILKRKFFS